MSDNTSIEWTRGDDGAPGATWNPVTGCTKVSPGCDHCYAETFAERWRGIPGHHFENGFDVTLRPERLGQPLRWRKPRRVFVNSMSDLFHRDIPDEFIVRVFATMAATPRHTYQLLTKRHGRMRSLLSDEGFVSEVAQEIVGHHVVDGDPMPEDGNWWPLRNLWLGVSVEDQKRADLRVPALLQTPAAVHWLSCEPLLGPVDLTKWLDQHGPWNYVGPGVLCYCGEPVRNERCTGDQIDWVVAGGESGPRSRPMHPDWVRSLRDQCQEYGTPFFMKQWGNWVPPSEMPSDTFIDWDLIHGTDIVDRDIPVRVSKNRAGRLLDGRTWDEYPQPSVVSA